MADEETVVAEEVKETPEVAVAEPELPLEIAEEKPVEGVAEEPEKAVEEPVVEEPEQPALPPWVKKELSKRAQRIAEAKQALAEKDAEIERLKGSDPLKVSEDYIPKSQVKALVQQEREEEKYIENCNAANQSGQTTYGKDWADAVNTLTEMGGFDPPTLKAIMATGRGDKAIYTLGKDPGEYHRIMDMPLDRRIVEITRLVDKPVAQAKPVSQAPAPVRPVGGSAAAPKVELNDKMSDEEWYQAAKAQRAKRFAAQNRR